MNGMDGPAEAEEAAKYIHIFGKLSLCTGEIRNGQGLWADGIGR